MNRDEQGLGNGRRLNGQVRFLDRLGRGLSGRRMNTIGQDIGVPVLGLINLDDNHALRAGREFARLTRDDEIRADLSKVNPPIVIQLQPESDLLREDGTTKRGLCHGDASR